MHSAGEEAREDGSDGMNNRTVNSHTAVARVPGYCTRSCATLRNGSQVEVRSFECVSDGALKEAANVVQCMLEAAPVDVLERMASSHVAVIGRDQVTSDMPPHRFLRATQASLGVSPPWAGARRC